MADVLLGISKKFPREAVLIAPLDTNSVYAIFFTVISLTVKQKLPKLCCQSVQRKICSCYSVYSLFLNKKVVFVSEITYIVQ